MEEANKSILIITQYFLPDITAAAYRMGDMYDVVNEDYNVDVVTTYPHKFKTKITNDPQNIYRIEVKGNSKNKYIKYLNQYFGFMFKAIIKAKGLPKHYDYVFVTSPPIFSLIAGYIIAKRKKAKLIIDIRDIWPDVLLDDGTLSEKNIVFKLVKKLEKFIYAKADQITCVSKYMAQYIEEFCGKPVKVIYNGISEDMLKDVSVRERRLKKEKLNLFYTGNVGFFQHLDVLVEAFENCEIQDKYDVTIIGGGATADKFQKKVEDKGLGSILKVLEPLEKQQVSHMVSQEADLLFLNLYDSKTLRRTIPSKLFDYFAFNLPIVYGIKGEGHELLESLGCGIQFEWDNARSLEVALLELFEHYTNYLQRSQGNQEYVHKKFDRQHMFQQFWMSMETD